MGEPGDRNGVTGVSSGECPLQIRPVKTPQDVDVFLDILRVVIVDELVPTHLTKGDPYDNGKENTDDARANKFIVRPRKWDRRLTA